MDVTVVNEAQCVTWKSGQLCYVGRECRNIPFFLANTYGKRTRHLDISCNYLRDLNGLESFINLEELVLDDNLLDDNVRFPVNLHLRILSLNKNKFKNLDLLLTKLSKSYPNLIYLSLHGNEVCPDQLSNKATDDDYRRYKYYVIYKLKKLSFLDSSAISAAEKREAIRIGPYMKVIKPDYKTLKMNNDDIEPIYTPLPLITTSTRGSFGSLRHRYTGKHSEGNRFIRNNEL